jgi:hypothetical protein
MGMRLATGIPSIVNVVPAPGAASVVTEKLTVEIAAEHTGPLMKI